MKQVYMNARLHPLPVAARREPVDWIFSQGERWLLLTPPRLRRLAALLGLEDARVSRLFGMVRRWHPRPGDFGRALGVETPPQPTPPYPPAVCPCCDRVHAPHPEDAARPCPECLDAASLPDTAHAADRRLDLRVRSRMLREDPLAFDENTLNEYWRINRRRRLRRDWEGAVRRILLGRSYRDVARELHCSIGLLHKKVSEARHWEWN